MIQSYNTTLSMIINCIGLESTVCSSTVLHAVEVEFIFRYDYIKIERSIDKAFTVFGLSISQ